MKTFRNTASGGAAHEPASDQSSGNGGLAPRSPSPNHVVHFYDEHRALADSACAFLAGGLLRGAPAVVIVAADRREIFRTCLAQMGIDLERATRTRQLLILDSEDTLNQLLVDGMPSEQRFREVIAALVAAQIEIWRPSKLLAYGDMVDLLFARGEQDAAITLEALWDDLAHRLGFGLYCAYDGRFISKGNDRAAFDAICRHHGSIVPSAAWGPSASGLVEHSA
jgi:hypothetical protein